MEERRIFVTANDFGRLNELLAVAKTFNYRDRNDLKSPSLVPLVEIAWADGPVDTKEKNAILNAVKQSKQAGGSMDHELLERWLKQRPPPELLEAWMHYMQGLCEQLSQEEVAALKEEFIKHARTMANASGGFLRLSGNISKSESNLFKKLESAFVAGGV